MFAQAMAANGGKVYIVGRTGEKLDTVAKTYSQDVPGQIIPIQADCTSKKDIAELYKQIAEKEEHLDILVSKYHLMFALCQAAFDRPQTTLA